MHRKNSNNKINKYIIIIIIVKENKVILEKVQYFIHQNSFSEARVNHYTRIRLVLVKCSLTENIISFTGKIIKSQD